MKDSIWMHRYVRVMLSVHNEICGQSSVLSIFQIEISIFDMQDCQPTLLSFRVFTTWNISLHHVGKSNVQIQWILFSLETSKCWEHSAVQTLLIFTPVLMQALIILLFLLKHVFCLIARLFVLCVILWLPHKKLKYTMCILLSLSEAFLWCFNSQAHQACSHDY